MALFYSLKPLSFPNLVPAVQTCLFRELDPELTFNYALVLGFAQKPPGTPDFLQIGPWNLFLA